MILWLNERPLAEDDNPIYLFIYQMKGQKETVHFKIWNTTHVNQFRNVSMVALQKSVKIRNITIFVKHC